MNEIHTDKSYAPVGIKAISILLVVGGIAGVVVAMWAEARAQILSHLTFLGFAVLLFGWSVWVGIDLWKEKPRSSKWAQLLFMLQIPSISFHGFAYQFYVGLMLGPSFTSEGDSKLNFEFQLGSLLNFQISSQIENLIVGVNLIAVAALVYLMVKSSRKAHLGASAGD